jgi:hypothetical protein
MKKKRRVVPKTRLAAAASGVSAEAMEARVLLSANPFTPGDIVVYRVGTGTGALGSSATAVFLDEYTPGGALVQSIAMPTTASEALTAGGTAASEGQITLSPDGSTLAITGYDVVPGAATQGTDNGTVGLIGASASPTYYVLPSASVVNGNNIRSAVVDGNNLYVSGAASYIQYASVSSLASGGAFNSNTTAITSTVKNVEDLQIFNGQLYFSTQHQSSYSSLGADSIGSMGSGEPVTGSQSYAGVADASTASDSFFFEHLGGGTGTPNTLYVADSSAGIEKYSLSGSTWSETGSVLLGTSGAIGITGSVNSAGRVTIFATGNTSGLYTITDSSGLGGTFSGTAKKIVAPSANEAFDGVALAPDDGVGAITGLGGITNYQQGTAAVSPAAAAAFSDASNFAGGTLVVSGGLANDTLGITPGGNGITTSGNAVSYDGTQIGTFSGGSGSTALTVAFNNVGGNPVTSAAVQALIDQVAFSSTTASTLGDRTLSFQVTENSGAADTAATQTVNVAVAVAPSINALGTLNISQGAGQQTIGLSGIQHNGGTGTITVTASSDAPSLIPNAGQGAVAVVYTSPNSTGAVTFTPVAGASGIAHITITVTDSGGSATATATVNVIAPPVNTVPAAQDVVGNFANSFSTSSSNALSIADPAAGTNPVQVALSVSHGTLALNGTSGLTFTSGAVGEAGFTVTGTIANINAALNGLTYTPASGYTGTDTLQLVTDDLGNTPSGSAQSATSTVALTVVAPPSVLLNEIEANPPGTQDLRYEYVELSGTPGQRLTNTYFVAFDGTVGDTGTADLVVSLSGYSLGSDGLLVIQSSASTGHSIPSATTLVPDPTFFTQSGGFINGSLSFFLFDSPNAGFTARTDYDTNDDGTLDHLPAGAVALDSVAIPDTNNPSDIVYGNVEVVDETAQNLGTADAVTRFPSNDSTTNAAWFGGELVDTGNVDSQIDYDPTRQSANEPANAYLTPGAVNYPQPPVFSPASYSFNVQQAAAAGTAVGTVSATPGGSDTLSYGLTGTGSTNFVINRATGAITVASGASLSGTGYSLTATATDAQDGDTSTAPVTVTVVAPPPTVVSVTPEDNAGNGVAAGSAAKGQRSMETQIAVVFNEPVNLASGAFALGLVNDYGSGANDGSPHTSLTGTLGTPTNPSGDGETWIIPILSNGSNSYALKGMHGGISGASLDNGVYQLNVVASDVTAAGGAAMASNYTSAAWHRLFGDIDNARRVFNTEYSAFLAAFTSTYASNGATNYNQDLDYDGDGRVFNSAYAAFLADFGSTKIYSEPQS